MRTKKAHTIHAARVVFAATDPLLRGRGIVEELPASSSSSTRIVRADGYRILIDPATQLSFTEPLHSIDDLHTSQWLEYQGRLREDGILVAQKAHLEANIIAPREQHLQQKYNYDPKQASRAEHPADMTGSVGRLLSGRDPAHIPPANDPLQQQRLERIGQRLIPHYLFSLSADDPARIDFRFQLIDEHKIHKGVALPNGIVLIPREIATRLDNDDQYAAYVASCMAGIIEKQQLRFQNEMRLLNAPTVTALAVYQPLFLPLMSARENLLQYESEESIRVALGLVHDAGYKLAEAPKAWWLLSSSKKEPLTAIPIPFESAYAYAMLGALWRNEIERTATPTP